MLFPSNGCSETGYMSLGELQGPLKVPLEVLQAVVVDKEQCAERVAEYTMSLPSKTKQKSIRVFWLSCQQPFPREAG